MTIFRPFCDTKIGQKFGKKCQTEPPKGKGKESPKGKGEGGKGKRRRARDNNMVSKDILDAFDELSLDDKNRLLSAMEDQDEYIMDVIFKEFAN